MRDDPSLAIFLVPHPAFGSQGGAIDSGRVAHLTPRLAQRHKLATQTADPTGHALPSPR